MPCAGRWPIDGCGLMIMCCVVVECAVLIIIGQTVEVEYIQTQVCYLIAFQ